MWLRSHIKTQFKTKLPSATDKDFTDRFNSKEGATEPEFCPDDQVALTNPDDSSKDYWECVSCAAVRLHQTV